MPRALVTGILGQDGTYLARLLTERGFDVHGLVGPGTAAPEGAAFTAWPGDLTDVAGLDAVVAEVAPDRVFNLAGVSSVAASWDDPVTTMAVNATGAVALLEASWMLQERTGRQVRFVQASSAEIFGAADVSPQDERTPLRPVNPYGASKAAAHLAVGVFRARGLHASSLVLYNHESPLRPPGFVSRKITSTVAAIARGEASELRLGNLDARRDWGWAPDVALALLLAGDAAAGDDYVIGTGASHSVREFVAAAFAHVGIADWQRYVVVDPAFFRPAEASDLRGDATRARDVLGWTPTVTFDALVAAMVDEDLEVSHHPIALWVVPVADLGGVARHTLDAAGSGIPGFRLVVLCPPGPLVGDLQALGVGVLVDAFGPAAGLRASVATLRRAVRTLRPAVVHTHLAYADIVAALTLGPGRLAPGRRGGWIDAEPGSRPRLISTEHGIARDDLVYHGTRTRSATMAGVHRARTSAFDLLIGVCASTRNVMVAKWHPRAPIEVVLNGVDRPATPPARRPGLRVASIARLSPEKGIDRLLDAFALVRAEHPDATLTIAGTGPLEADLRATASRLGIVDAVTFPGFVPAHEVLADADVLVQLSVWENCSYTLLDACAAGRGVVATPVGGNPEILPGRCLVASADAAGVAAAIVTQGLEPASRPGLSASWPTVAAMTGQLARLYGGAPR